MFIVTIIHVLAIFSISFIQIVFLFICATKPFIYCFFLIIIMVSWKSFSLVKAFYKHVYI